jgi:hypothetical protein
MIRKVFSGLALAMSLAVTGCGSSGVQNAELLNQPLASKQARVKIVRSSSFAGSAASSRVHMDGRQIADLANGAAVVHDVTARRHEIMVDAWGHPGEYTVAVDAKHGMLYTYEISPREDAVIGGMFGLAGMLADQAANGNIGYFQVQLVKEEPLRG